MGLTISIKGYKGAYDCGYITYGNFLMELCKAYYPPEMSKLYCAQFLDYDHKDGLTEEESKYWNAHCNDDIDLLLWHSMCEGKLTPKECRKIYEQIKNLHSDMQGHNYGEMVPYNMFEKWKDMLLFCAQHRVNMNFR